MNIAPLSIRVIIDIYETGLSALGKFKKANTCLDCRANNSALVNINNDSNEK